MEKSFKGEVSARAVREFRDAMARRPPRRIRVVLDLEAADIADAEAVTEFVNLLKDLLAWKAEVELVGAPQVLAHNIYRADLLGAVKLSDTRQDEGAGN